MTIKVTAKCSDMFNAELIADNGVSVGSYDGYVPNYFPNPKVQHYGDYVELDIDIETGRILNWKKPSKSQLEKTFKFKVDK